MSSEAFKAKTFSEWNEKLEILKQEVDFELTLESGRSINDPHEVIVFLNTVREITSRMERSAMDYAIANDWTYDQIWAILKRHP